MFSAGITIVEKVAIGRHTPNAKIVNPSSRTTNARVHPMVAGMAGKNSPTSVHVRCCQQWGVGVHTPNAPAGRVGRRGSVVAVVQLWEGSNANTQLQINALSPEPQRAQGLVWEEMRHVGGGN